MERFKPIPIGHEDFKTIIENGCYYVDKTLMIKDLIDCKSMVSLFTRPGRFGKTLNMSMDLSINAQSNLNQNLNSPYQAAIPCDKYISL